jgi:hypothetical protein
MVKMRMISRPTTWSSLARGTSLAVAVAYLLQPLTASAASVRVCAAAGDACSKFVDKYISPFIVLLTALIGVLAVISYILAAIQYSSASDDPGAVSKAKNRAFQTTLGLLGYFFLFAFINYIIPGGLF